MSHPFCWKTHYHISDHPLTQTHTVAFSPTHTKNTQIDKHTLTVNPALSLSLSLCQAFICILAEIQHPRQINMLDTSK